MTSRAACAGRLFAPLAALLLLAACTRAPDEAARRFAIADHVVRTESYPEQYVAAENFAFRNLQRVPDAEPAQYAVEADFDLTWTADGKAIVAALREDARAERDKQKRRADNVLEKVTAVLGDALASAELEQRFADVKVGDSDHYAGRFVLARNEDGSWRVVDADYR
jgi:Skp family chaperone for outer membrane proteins